jgi:rod shape-determining protein MreC
MKRGVILFTLSLVIIIFDRMGYLNWFKSPLVKLIQPIQVGIRGGVIEEKQDNSEALSLVLKAEMMKLKQENEKLRELLGTKVSPSWKFIPAKVIKSEGGDLVIDVGSKIGVETEMVVVALAREEVNNGILIGGIESVSEYQSRVRLLYDKESKLDVVMESGGQGVVVGDGEKLMIKEVLLKQGLMEGDLVMSRGADGWPSDLVVGRVAGVKKIDTEVFLEAMIDEVVEVGSLREVFVVSF